MNYTSLKAAIKSYTENVFPDTLSSSGLTSDQQINVFIAQAEQRIFNSVQLLDLRKSVTSACVANNRFITAPADWLSTFSIAIVNPTSGEFTYLLNKDVDFLRAAFPNPSSYAAPQYYALFDASTFMLAPTPNLAYAVELHYFYYPESIVTAGTSWLGDNFDSVLLYGALLEAYTQMKGEEDVIANYQKRYDEALAMLKQLGEGRNRTDNYRTVQTRYPVR
jgi:hypothetical protein